MDTFNVILCNALVETKVGRQSLNQADRQSNGYIVGRMDRRTDSPTDRQKYAIYRPVSPTMYIYLLKAYSPVNCTGSTSGFFTKSHLTQIEYKRKHAHITNVRHINIVRKLVPLVLLS